MYEKLLESTYLTDALFLLSYHLLRSYPLRIQLLERTQRNSVGPYQA